MIRNDWIGRIVLFGALVISGLALIPEGASACSQCFGTSVNNATTFGIAMSMLGLLGFLGIVFGGIGMFVMRVRSRSNRLDPDNWGVTENGELEVLDD